VALESWVRTGLLFNENGFLAIFGGMTVVPLGGQTDMLGAGTFWLVNVAARWFLR
jgi:hypothetical protein